MPLHITKITLREIRLRLREPFEISSGLTTDRRILLLELHDGDGHTVWSECVAGERPNYSPETVDTAWLAITEWLAPRVLSGGVAHPADLDTRLATGIRGHRMARAAIEMGGWALWAERERMSLSRLLGGRATPSRPESRWESRTHQRYSSPRVARPSRPDTGRSR